MPLDKAAFETSIKNLLDTTFENVGDSQAARDNFASSLANHIDTYIKSARITIPATTIVVTGSATTQSNPAPLVFNNIIT